MQDCINVRYICKTICRRSASLLSAAVATIVNRMAVRHVTVAYDGGVYKKHPKYKEHLREKIKGLVNPEIAVSEIFIELQYSKSTSWMAEEIPHLATNFNNYSY